MSLHPKEAERPRSSVWWLNPVLLVCFNVAIVYIALGQSDESFEVEYSSAKWITWEYAAICSVALLFLLIGCYFGYWGYAKRPARSRERVLNAGRLRTAFYVSVAICFAAYAIWYLNFIRINGLGAFFSFLNIGNLSSEVYNYKENSGSISGVTTFTEVGVVSAILAAVVMQSPAESEKERKRVGILFLILCLLAVIRASLFSERLAIMELVVPFAIAWFGVSGKPLGKVDRWLPLAAVVALIVVFAVFEYARSWLNHYVNYYDSYWDFISTRLFGYYTNAANTEAMYVKFGEISWFPPYWTIQWLWKMPVVGTVYDSLASVNIPNLFNGLLSLHANPEYNNSGGVLTFYKDLSWLGLPLYFVFGYILGRYYCGFKSGDPQCQLIYPLLYLTMLELPRYYYLGNQRGFVVIVGVLIVLFVAGRKRATERDGGISRPVRRAGYAR